MISRWCPRSRQRQRQYPKAAQARPQKARSMSTQRVSLKWTTRWASPWPSWPRRSRRARRRRRRKVQSLQRKNWRILVRSRRWESNPRQRRPRQCSVAAEVKIRTHHSTGTTSFYWNVVGHHSPVFIIWLSLSRDVSGSHSKSKKSPSPPTLLPQKSKVTIFKITITSK